jgi:hypothetical protein
MSLRSALCLALTRVIFFRLPPDSCYLLGIASLVSSLSSSPQVALPLESRAQALAFAVQAVIAVALEPTTVPRVASGLTPTYTSVLLPEGAPRQDLLSADAHERLVRALDVWTAYHARSGEADVVTQPFPRVEAPLVYVPSRAA